MSEIMWSSVDNNPINVVPPIPNLDIMSFDEDSFAVAFSALMSNNLLFALIECKHALSRYCSEYPVSTLAEYDLCTHEIEDSVIPKKMSKDFPPHTKGCKCRAPSDVEAVRWFALKSFVLFRMVHVKKVSHEEHNIKRVRSMFLQVPRIIHLYGLCNTEEFAYLKMECKLKYAILTIDYLPENPWKAWKMLKSLRYTKLQNDTTSRALITAYLSKAEGACMMYYLRGLKRKNEKKNNAAAACE